jgi:beta-lactamase superfamily II metal-dependent hydrolase
MADYMEVDFHDVETAKSGDAISLRVSVNGVDDVHIVDGGYLACGQMLLDTIAAHYGNPGYIDRVILTHPDGDHASGLRYVLENASVGELWMLRPWNYADELIERFPTYNSVDRLKSLLRKKYSYVADLETIAEEKGIPIYEPLQGTTIGQFTVLAPSRDRYLDLIVASEKTPDGIAAPSKFEAALESAMVAVRAAVSYVKSKWGDEIFSTGKTSVENEMSVVQFAHVNGTRFLLTGDAGREALAEAADYAPYAGLYLPGIDRFQVPHHGSRRNVSAELLDRFLGSKLQQQPQPGSETFTAIISSAKADKDHPRKAVVRALLHRGARVYTTETGTVRTASPGAPTRAGWAPLQSEAYPDEQEDA